MLGSRARDGGFVDSVRFSNYFIIWFKIYTLLSFQGFGKTLRSESDKSTTVFCLINKRTYFSKYGIFKYT